MSDSTALADEMYVGYLPVGVRQRAFLKVAVPSVLWVMVMVGFAWAWTQNDPGPAVWEDSKPEVFVGTVVAKPYPMLLAEDNGEGRAGAMLLVEVGKRGFSRAMPEAGQRVALSGWRLHRNGRAILELEPGEAAFAAVPAAAPSGGRARPAMDGTMSVGGPVTLRGEIVDAKCFLGAMKPGDGKTHKQCATLCIAGNIPAMLVTTDAGGFSVFYLLQGEGGGALDSALWPLIADPVEVSGQLNTLGDLKILTVRAGDVRRL